MDTPTERSDSALIAAAKRGDQRAFESLYTRHRDFVYRLAHRFCGDFDLAHDVVQETFIYLLSKLDSFELRAQFTTFLYPVVKHRALTARQRRDRLNIGDAPAREPAAEPFPTPAGEMNDKLHGALNALSTEQREVVLMRVVDGMALEEIGIALGIPLGTVKSRLHHALNALRDDHRTQSYFPSATPP